jgi:hypothetical protein
MTRHWGPRCVAAHPGNRPTLRGARERPSLLPEERKGNQKKGGGMRPACVTEQQVIEHTSQQAHYSHMGRSMALEAAGAGAGAAAAAAATAAAAAAAAAVCRSSNRVGLAAHTWGMGRVTTTTLFMHLDRDFCVVGYGRWNRLHTTYTCCLHDNKKKPPSKVGIPPRQAHLRRMWPPRLVRPGPSPARHWRGGSARQRSQPRLRQLRPAG